MRELEDRHYIRHQIFEEHESSSRKYRRLVIGDGSWWDLLKYEALSTGLGRIPGALGLVLRKRLYPLMFDEIGKGVVFGRDVVVRNPRRIRIGDGVVIDDDCVIDARGGEPGGVTIGDRVILNRGAVVQAKVGPIHIGAESDIGAGCGLYSQGGIHIGEKVAMGGRCIVGGGLIDPSVEPVASDVPGSRHQRKVSKGPVHIEDAVVMGMAVIVLDGVRIGSSSIVGAGCVLREAVPPHTIVVPHERLVLLPRPDAPPEARANEAVDRGRVEPPAAPAPSEEPPPSESVSGEADPRTVAAVLAAIDEVNLQLPPGSRLAKSMEASLHGNGGPLDSLGLVNLLVATEERMAEAFRCHVTLADDAILAEGQNPLHTVRSFIEYVEARRKSG